MSKLLLLLKVVLEPQGAASSQAFANTAPIEWHRAKLFVPATLGPVLELLREAHLFTEDDGSPLRILQEPSLIRWPWQPGSNPNPHPTPTPTLTPTPQPQPQPHNPNPNPNPNPNLNPNPSPSLQP